MERHGHASEESTGYVAGSTNEGGMDPHERDELIDMLMELQHELGKYVRMPVAFLPADASDEMVHAALRKALLQTRDGPRGVRSARALWSSFVDEAAGRLEGIDAFRALVGAVERALAWEPVALGAPSCVDRRAIEADVSAVTPAIRAVIGELER